MKPIGQLYQNDAHVIRHCEYHPADTLSLTFFRGLERKFAQFADPGDYVRGLFTEHLFQILICCFRIFEGIVEETACNTDRVKLHIRQNAGNFQGMSQIRFAGETHLSRMHTGRIYVSPVYDVKINARAVAGDPI